MKINTAHGTMTLDDDARPSIDDQNDIVNSLTRAEKPPGGYESNDDEHESEASSRRFQALCDACGSFPCETTAEFYAACEAWLASNPDTVA